jgi:hypothetical protein
MTAVWLEAKWLPLLAAWRADLSAMEAGTYKAPLPHINIVDGWDPRHLAAVRGWRARGQANG